MSLMNLNDNKKVQNMHMKLFFSKSTNNMYTNNNPLNKKLNMKLEDIYKSKNIILNVVEAGYCPVHHEKSIYDPQDILDISVENGLNSLSFIGKYKCRSCNEDLFIDYKIPLTENLILHAIPLFCESTLYDTLFPFNTHQKKNMLQILGSKSLYNDFRDDYVEGRTEEHQNDERATSGYRSALTDFLRGILIANINKINKKLKRVLNINKNINDINKKLDILTLGKVKSLTNKNSIHRKDILRNGLGSNIRLLKIIDYDSGQNAMLLDNIGNIGTHKNLIALAKQRGVPVNDEIKKYNSKMRKGLNIFISLEVLKTLNNNYFDKIRGDK